MVKLTSPCFFSCLELIGSFGFKLLHWSFIIYKYFVGWDLIGLEDPKLVRPRRLMLLRFEVVD